MSDIRLVDYGVDANILLQKQDRTLGAIKSYMQNDNYSEESFEDSN